MYLSLNIKDNNKSKQTFYLFCAFWLVIGLLQFFQDYISSVLNNSHFVVWESISYKFLWLFFIPLSLLLVFALKKSKAVAKPLRFLLGSLYVFLITASHLLLFSLFLHGLSRLVHQDNFWSFNLLLTEKLSNYLYIAISIYAVMAIAYFWFARRDKQKVTQQQIESIAVKNGRKSTIVKVESIKWIGSDGPYIILHTTNNKKHIISDSLKNIITKLPDNFKRIHRSTILNIDMVKEVTSRLNGDYDVILEDSKTLRLSRTYTPSLKGTLL